VSHNANSKHAHTSGHKNFATFSAILKNDGDKHAAPSFLHYMAVATSLTASSAAAFGVPKVMAFSIPGWLEGLQMSRTTLCALISAANLAGALTQPCIGRIVDSWGPRVALSGMLALTSISFAAPAFAADIDIPILRCVVMFLALFGIRSLQAGIDTAGNVLVNNWFLKLRGRISSTRQVVFMFLQDLVLVQIVQGMDDWRAICWLSAAVAFCAVCIMLIGVTNAPEEAQLKPDGGRLEAAVGGTEVAAAPSPAHSHAPKGKKKSGNEVKEHKDSGGPSFTLSEAMNTSSFWILLFNNVLYCSIGPTTTLMLLDIVLDTLGGNANALKAIDVATFLYLPHFIVAAVVGVITGWLIDYGVQVKYILCYSNMCQASVCMRS
jgi:MFS family permease